MNTDTSFIIAQLFPNEPNEKIVDVDEAYPQEESEKTTKVSNEAVVVICEGLPLNYNLSLGHSLKFMGICKSANKQNKPMYYQYNIR